MGYILKNTSGLVNTRITDTGRMKLSQGNFKISYFQVGDSEVSYDKLPNTYNQSNSMVLEPQFNSQNSAGVPESNKQYVKYPYLVDQGSKNTYGIPYMDSVIDSVYNRAAMRGFFDGVTSGSPITWKVLTGDYYAVTANYVVQMNSLSGTNQINLIYVGCNTQNLRTPGIGDIITIFYDGNGLHNCYCENLPTPTPTPTLTATPVISPTAPVPSPSNPCDSPTPTPTPTRTPCITPSPYPVCPAPPAPECYMSMNSCFAILTYRIIDVCGNLITLDRATPNYTEVSTGCYARTVIYPPSMTVQYDTYTPRPHWANSVIDFESICDIDQFNVKIWNMNIPWTENPAGLIPTLFDGYTKFGSIDYIGSKEYFGYNSSSGQTSTDDVYYYNSFDEKKIVKPEEQKAIAIIHYTNQTIDFFYGEKFALQPYDPTNPQDTTGQARNFKLHIPTLMWHKNPQCCFGQTFWVDPPGFDGKNLFQVQYIESKVNLDMNQPGLRYYNLWDTNPNSNGLPSRVGKVFPDSQIVIIDDEEIVAALSYKSNRNWTLPAPQLSLLTPNTCDDTSGDGILTGSSQTMYITYLIENDTYFTNSLHCNYYSYIVGNNNECNPDVSKNIAVRFGPEFPCLIQPNYQPNIPTPTPTPTPTLTQDYCQCVYLDITISQTDLDAASGNTDPSLNGVVNFEYNLCSIPSPVDSVQYSISGTYTNDLCVLSTEVNNSFFYYFQNDVLQFSEGGANIDSTYTTAGCCPAPTPTPTATYVVPTPTPTNCGVCDLPSGFWGTDFKILAQLVPTGTRPDSTKWRLIDFTNNISGNTINGYITQSALTGNTFVITPTNYQAAPYYNLNDYIDLVPVGTPNPKLNFGDEYYFYGNLETDIQATIYEMKYKINLSQTEFVQSQNPTWVFGTPSYITEIGLFDENKDLLVISKLQSPTLRQGIQQYVVKLDL